jgi:hypothetical protein
MKTLATTLTLAAAALVLAAPAEAKTPALYTQVHSGFLSAAAHAQTRGTVSCPAGTVAWGGGAVIAGDDLGGNINSSFPMSGGSGWIADINNASSSAMDFTVNVVCAKAPRKYRIVEGPEITDPAFSMSATGTQSCPAGTAVLGGGSVSNTTGFSIDVGSSFPSGNGWRTDMSNQSDFDTTFNVFAICGKAPRSYAVVTGPAVDNAPGTQSNATVSCARGQALSGGAQSSSSLVQVTLNSTIPDPAIGGWAVFENNSGSQDSTVRAIVICA